MGKTFETFGYGPDDEFAQWEVLKKEYITIKRLTHQILTENEAAMIKEALGL